MQNNTRFKELQSNHPYHQPQPQLILIKIKINYLQQLLRNITIFQRSHNIVHLKQAAYHVSTDNKNQKKLIQMVQEIYNKKQQKQGSLTQQEKQLKRKIEQKSQEIQVIKRDIACFRQRQRQFQQKVQKQKGVKKQEPQILQNKKASLQNEIKKQRSQFQIIKQKLKGKRFYKEYAQMERECQGVKQKNIKLKMLIQEKKRQISQAKSIIERKVKQELN